MDYRDFTKRDEAYDGFVAHRKRVLEQKNFDKFMEEFANLCSLAMEGDCVAQDCVAYFFNKGVQGYLSPNYEYYMSWEILAGANGNEFALEKLEFFLNLGLEAIINEEEILTEALRRRNITKKNAIMVISNLLCEAIADNLKLDPKNLIDLKREKKPYTPERNRIFQNALENSILPVAQYLVS